MGTAEGERDQALTGQCAQSMQRAGPVEAIRGPKQPWPCARWQTARMAVRRDCRHYSTRTTVHGEVIQRCRVAMAEDAPFACPGDCLCFEPRPFTDAGWHRFEE